MYYVYLLLDSSKPGDYQYGDFKFNFEPFYVGKGKGYRIKNTTKDLRSNLFKSNKIKKLLENNIEIIKIKLFENIEENESLQKEIMLIKTIGRRNLNNGPLVNLTDGGEGLSGFVYTEETLKKRSISQTGEGNGFFGHKHTEEVRKKHSLLVRGESHPMFGKKHSEETIKKLKEHREKKISNKLLKEVCQKFNKSVLMFDLNMNFIEEFNSVKECSQKTGINESIISKCCRGDIKSPTRYFFKYKDIDSKIKNNKFIINVGDTFYFKGLQYKLVKRNRITSICENPKGELETIHYDDFKALTFKDSNDSDLIELFLYLKSIDSNFKISDNLIYNGLFKFKYIKLLNNSEIIKPKNYLLNDVSDILIFEDEWCDKKEIVKSRILNLLGKSKKIWARKCSVRFVDDNNLVRDFLIGNHIQGYVGSVYKIGLFLDDRLVSLMTFGNLRKNMGQSSKEGYFELLRFCNLIGYSVVGGASKMFNFFLNNVEVNNILSYADRRWSNGDLYEKLGFEKIKNTIPNYFYIISNKREGRFKFRKDMLISQGFNPTLTEVEIQHGRGYYRIFDRGSIRYEFKN
jgi:group I intron endonuclease